MKELVMTARLRGTWEHTRPAQVAGWLKQLVGRADRLLVYMPAADGLQCWLRADGAASRTGVEWWRRLAFRPLHGRRVPAADGGVAEVEWEVAVDCLPPVCLYRAEGLAALLCRGMVPQLVALEGEVLPMEGLTRQQLRRSGTAFAVLNCDLAQRLGLGLPAACFAASAASGRISAADSSAVSGISAASSSDSSGRGSSFVSSASGISASASLDSSGRVSASASSVSGISAAASSDSFGRVSASASSVSGISAADSSDSSDRGSVSVSSVSGISAADSSNSSDRDSVSVSSVSGQIAAASSDSSDRDSSSVSSVSGISAASSSDSSDRGSSFASSASGQIASASSDSSDRGSVSASSVTGISAAASWDSSGRGSSFASSVSGQLAAASSDSSDRGSVSASSVSGQIAAASLDSSDRDSSSVSSVSGQIASASLDSSDRGSVSASSASGISAADSLDSSGRVFASVSSVTGQLVSASSDSSDRGSVSASSASGQIASASLDSSDRVSVSVSSASGISAAGWPETPERLMRQVEDCLQRLFSGGAEAGGDCPLKVSPQLRQVPPERIHRVPDALRTLQFADGGTSLSVAHGWEAYGLYRPSSHRHHRLVMLYPQGFLDEARRFFRFLCGQSMQLPLWWQSDESRWAAYNPGPAAFRQLEQTLLHPGVPDAEGAVTVYVLLIPGGGERTCAPGTPLAARLHRLARLWGDVVWGPFPLHGLESPALAYTFASQLARLSLRLGGLPWRPLPAAVSGAGVAAGVAACSGGTLLDSLYAFTTLEDEEGVCSDCRCGRLAQLPFFLADRLGRLCRMRALRRPDGPRQQVVVCLRADFPAAAQEALTAALLPLLSECGVVLAHCRLTPHLLPLCVDETRPGGFPPAGTCLTLASGEHLLYCREAPVGMTAFSGRSAERCTWRRCAPLAVRFSRLDASGSLLPVEGTAVPQLLGRVYRWVCGNPLRTDGSPWPYVLAHAADALRRYHRECCDGLHPGVVCQ